MKQKSNKSKKRNVGLILLCIIVLCAVVLTAFFLIGEFSQAKRDYEAQIKKETQDMTEKLISEIDEVDTSDEGLTSSEAVNGSSSTTQVPAAVRTEAEKDVIGQELSKLEDERKQMVLQTLSAAYSSALNQQKQEALQMVDDLIAQGKAEWAALVTKGEGTAVNKAAMASEYLAKSQVMEDQMDSSFDALVAKMEEQLQAEGIDPTAIINQYKEEYNRIKEENRKAFMSKVMGAINN